MPNPSQRRSPFLLSCLLGVSLLLSACFSLAPQSDPTTYYLLEASDFDVEVAAAGSGAIHVSRVELPDHIDTNRIFFRQSDGKPRYLEAERWAEPVADGLGRALAVNLGQLTGRDIVSAYPNAVPSGPGQRIRVTVLRFEAVQGSGVRLDAVYEVADGSDDRRSPQRVRIEYGEGNYRTAAAMVSDMNAAILRLAEEIASQLSTAR